MKIALITDIHFDVRNSNPFFQENLFKFFSNTFFPYLEENRIKNLLILGDTFDKRKYLSINTLYQSKKFFFEKLYNHDIKTKMLIGNHDIPFKDRNEINSISHLEKEFPCIEIVHTHSVFDFAGTRIAMISWINESNYEESMKFIQTANAEILCGHFEIEQFEMTKGSRCEKGLSASLFNRYEYVFSGHFHVIGNDGRIFYIGNPNQTNWGDWGLKKGFHIFDTQTREIEFIENPYSVYERITYKDNIDVLNYDYESFQDKIIRVYVKIIELANRSKFDIFLDKLSEYCHSVEVQDSDLSMIDSIEDSTVIYTDTLELISQHVELIQMEDSDKTKIKSYFKEIYNESMERISS